MAGGGDGGGLCLGQAAGMQAGDLVPLRRLVDVGGGDVVGRDADLRQQGQAARAGGGEGELCCGRVRRWSGCVYLNRNVMRPFDRS